MEIEVKMESHPLRRHVTIRSDDSAIAVKLSGEGECIDFARLLAEAADEILPRGYECNIVNLSEYREAQEMIDALKEDVDE